MKMHFKNYEWYIFNKEVYLFVNIHKRAEHCNGIARTELFLFTPRKNLEKNLPSITIEIGATFKGKNLLPLGAK